MCVGLYPKVTPNQSAQKINALFATNKQKNTKKKIQKYKKKVSDKGESYMTHTTNQQATSMKNMFGVCLISVVCVCVCVCMCCVTLYVFVWVYICLYVFCLCVAKLGHYPRHLLCQNSFVGVSTNPHIYMFQQPNPLK